MKTAIVPGSFDPMTLGHRDIIERACGLFDRVIVAIMYNDAKKGRFSYEDRLEIAYRTLKGLDVEIIVKDGFLADFAAEVGAVAYVKGIRNAEDLEYENTMERFNSARNPACQTVYLPCRESMADLSSTKVYNRLRHGWKCDGLMAPEALEYIKKING